MNKSVLSITLNPGREKSVLNGHPWLFSGAIKKINGNPENGETIAVYSQSGKHLGWAAFSEYSKIKARMWSWNPDEQIDREFISQKVQNAVMLRERFVRKDETDAFRVIHAESDGLPGIIFDRYGEVGVLQCLTAGADFWRDDLLEILADICKVKTIYERSDADVRSLENLPVRNGLALGNEFEEIITIHENGLKFLVDIKNGHKTGFYLDQRRNRRYLRDLVKGKRVLNCFSYTGGFSVNAQAGGADEVISVDSSSSALNLAKENYLLNGLEIVDKDFVEADVFQYLRLLRDKSENYDVIILDPPKFAPTSAQAQKAARGYKDINLLAFKLLNPGGVLLTFSCSGGVSAELFQKIVASAAQDAQVKASIVDYLHQGPDHPVSLNFPEGTYLKGLVCSCWS